MNDNIGLTMLPYSVPGTDPGSVYRIVARTAQHYVAVRRLSENIYRIRFARIDNASLNLTGTTAEDWANKYNFKIGTDWTYMSIRALSSASAEEIVSRLIRVALISDSTLESLTNDNTDEGNTIEKAVAQTQQVVQKIVDDTTTDKKPPGGSGHFN